VGELEASASVAVECVEFALSPQLANVTAVIAPIAQQTALTGINSS
jgi:hypothetical protein